MLYPIVGQFVLPFLYLTIMLCSVEVKYVFTFSDVSMGSVASVIFFVHVKTLGRRKRNLFRRRPHPTVPSDSSSSIRPINDGDRFAPLGSVTATHVTHFEPLGESDVELDIS